MGLEALGAAFPVAAYGNLAAASSSGVMSYFGQQDANRANREMQESANAANLWSAQHQMEFQRDMANTAHQREVEDLKKAGLNPILSANAGAAVPAGASAQSSAAQMKNPYEGVAASMIGALSAFTSTAKTMAEMKYIDAQTNKTQVDTQKSRVETDVMKKDIPQSELYNDFYDVVRPYVKKLKSLIGPTGKAVATPKGGLR